MQVDGKDVKKDNTITKPIVDPINEIPKIVDMGKNDTEPTKEKVLDNTSSLTEMETLKLKRISLDTDIVKSKRNINLSEKEMKKLDREINKKTKKPKVKGSKFFINVGMGKVHSPFGLY